MVLPIAVQNPCRRVCVLLLLYILVAILTISVAILSTEKVKVSHFPEEMEHVTHFAKSI